MPAEPAEVFGIALWAMGAARTGTPRPRPTSSGLRVLPRVVKDVKAFNDFDTAGGRQRLGPRRVQTNANARLCMLQNKKLEFVIPKPKSELILDNYTIPTHAPDVDQAYSFINYMLEPAHQVADCSYLGYPLLLPGSSPSCPRTPSSRTSSSPTPRTSRGSSRSTCGPRSRATRSSSSASSRRRPEPVGRGGRGAQRPTRLSRRGRARPGRKSSSAFVRRTRSMPSRRGR